MKYVVAIIAIFAEMLLYGLLCAFMGWRYGGGALIIMLMFSIYGATWRGVMRYFKQKETRQSFRENSSDML